AAHRGFPWFIFDAFTQYNEQGPDYIHALLVSYDEEVPEGVTVPAGQHYNPAFMAGHFIGMAKPISDEQVEYTDGTPMTVDQYARDISAFLMWAAEPHMEERKKMGFRVIIFLLVFASLLYFTKKKLWRNVEH
ncbi:MAG: cytochrome c1, partial [Pannonibacter phragmitetus]